MKIQFCTATKIENVLSSQTDFFVVIIIITIIICKYLQSIRKKNYLP